MMLVPRRNEFDLLDSMFEDPFFKTPIHKEIMKTDIKETDKEYILEIDMPGIDKKDVKVELEEGYLTVKAETSKEIDDSNKKYVHKERHYGSCMRSYYVGENIEMEDISAKLKDGVLNITVPKKEIKKTDAKKYIDIE